MNIVQNKIKYFKAWLLFYIFSIVTGIILVFCSGFLLRLVSEILKIDLNLIDIPLKVISFILGVIMSYIFYRWSVNKYIIPQAIILDQDNSSHLNNT